MAPIDDLKFCVAVINIFFLNQINIYIEIYFTNYQSSKF